MNNINNGNKDNYNNIDKDINVYLDNAASTKIDPDVSQLMYEINTSYGNPSSLHKLGREANALLENAREKVYKLFNCNIENVLFTSNASEANSMVIQYPYNRVAISKIEHKSLLDGVKAMSYQKDWIDISKDGVISKESLLQALEHKPDLVCVMHGNNETGVIQPIEYIRSQYDGLIHADSVQTIGKVDNIFHLVDSITISGHKIHGPKGAGILLMKDRSKYNKIIFGTRERNRRGGTENIAAICGTVLALEKAIANQKEQTKIAALRDYMENNLKKMLRIQINGEQVERVSNISNISFLDIPGDILLFKLDLNNIFVSSGSACNSGSLDRSYVLEAMGIPKEINKNTIRFSLSKYTTKEEIDHLLKVMQNIYTTQNVNKVIL